MSEGPPKKPHPPAESPEDAPLQMDAQEVLDNIQIITQALASFSLPGEARRELRTLKAAFTNLNYLFERGLDSGPAYVAFIQALTAITVNEALWGTLEKQGDPAVMATARLHLRKYQTGLAALQIQQFPFTGRIQ